MKKLTLALLFLLGSFGLVQAQETHRITVTGQGVVSAVPDKATVRVGVTTLSEVASLALSKNSEVMRKIMESLEDLNVSKKHLQTSELSLSPRWERRNNTNQQPKIIGYQASNILSVQVHELSALGTILDRLSSDGANQIQNISFGLISSESLLNEARKLAVKDAKSKADLYAEAAGASVGKVLSINEISGSRPMSMTASRMESMAADSVPIAEGTLDVRASINIVYALN